MTRCYAVMASSSLSHDDYTVAWICALPPEMAAAQSMLDETHDPLPQPATDHNVYTLGRLWNHYVAIVCMPIGIYGTTSAATVLAQMCPTFPSLRFGLMVGIGGGVPGKADVRLGDVVVSKPTATFSGVVQYDYGKTLTNRSFERTGSLNKPPQVLLTAISQIQSDHIRGERQIQQIIDSVLAKNKQMGGQFSRPRDDWLFRANYNHLDSAYECSKCDLSQLVDRPPRPTNEPHVHYGLIASGNQVMKDAQTRDQIAQELDILCFEMEAAGLMDQLPCLVIRGICDYCDSHKHKRWQGYASLTAAAYAKALLKVVPVNSTTNHTKMTNQICVEKRSVTRINKGLIMEAKAAVDYFRQQLDYGSQSDVIGINPPFRTPLEMWQKEGEKVETLYTELDCGAFDNQLSNTDISEMQLELRELQNLPLPTLPPEPSIFFCLLQQLDGLCSRGHRRLSVSPGVNGPITQYPKSGAEVDPEFFPRPRSSIHEYFCGPDAGLAQRLYDRYIRLATVVTRPKWEVVVGVVDLHRAAQHMLQEQRGSSVADLKFLSYFQERVDDLETALELNIQRVIDGLSEQQDPLKEAKAIYAHIAALKHACGIGAYPICSKTYYDAEEHDRVTPTSFPCFLTLRQPESNAADKNRKKTVRFSQSLQLP